MKTLQPFFFALLTSLLLLFACKGEPQDPDTSSTPPSLSEQLIGQWKSTLVEVQIKSFGGTEQDTTLMANESNSLKVLGYVSNLTTFQKDGTFLDTYLFENDSLSEGKGTWTLVENKLSMKQTTPEPLSNTYKISIDGDRLIVSGMVDIDGDGELDDILNGESRRTNPGQ